MLEEILKFNEEFVANKGYEKYATASKYPDKKIAIVTCMDTRLTELLPAALGIKNGDVKIIKNAGGVISHPFGSVVRSLLVAIYDLGVTEIMIVGHSDCGAKSMDSKAMIQKMKDRGISADSLKLIDFCGVDFDTWLCGIDSVLDSVREGVETLRNHPLIPHDVTVKGFWINSTTGKLTAVEQEPD